MATEASETNIPVFQDEHDLMVELATLAWQDGKMAVMEVIDDCIKGLKTTDKMISKADLNKWIDNVLLFQEKMGNEFGENLMAQMNLEQLEELGYFVLAINAGNDRKDAILLLDMMVTITTTNQVKEMGFKSSNELEKAGHVWIDIVLPETEKLEETDNMETCGESEKRPLTDDEEDFLCKKQKL